MSAIGQGTQVPSVNKQHLTPPVTPMIACRAICLVSVQEPKAGGDLGGEEELPWECDDTFDEIVFNHLPSDLAFSRLLGA